MSGNLPLRLGVSLLVAALCLIFVLPSFPTVRHSVVGDLLPDTQINLGLDLQGGMHLTLGVDMQKAIEANLAQAGRSLRDLAREEGVFILSPTVTRSDALQFVLPKPELRDDLDTVLEEEFSASYEVTSRETLDNGQLRYTLAMRDDAREELESLTLDQAVKTIRNRIDEFGVSEPDIRKQPETGRIVIQLPGLEEQQRALEILGRTAHLEFKMVDEEADVERAQKGFVPPGRELAMLLERQPNGEYSETPIVLEREVALTGEYITNAHVSFGQFNEPFVTIAFNPRGARLFENLTAENVNRRMAIVLDEKVYSAPVIRERIGGGSAQISGSFTLEEASDLAIVLRAGALPAPVEILEERSVGPSLGQESIDKGINAALIGGLIVVIFMAVYYGFGGVVANVVLAFNIILVMAGLSAFGATLTLPGIAGVILTLGMAVDANVLIFERIREELKNGLTPRAAVDTGYSRATLTILDANVTTIIAAIILFQFGTGPIRGFAVTLILGILASMFTAIFVSRIFFDLWVAKKRSKASLSI